MPDDDFPLAPGYRILPYAEQSEVTADDVLALWERERAVAPEEATRRVHEVLLVGLEGEDLAGLSTAYLQRNEQLGMDLWYFRSFVGPQHRLSGLALHLTITVRTHLEERFLAGDRRGLGIYGEVENEGLKRNRDDAIWPGDLAFVGQNERGDHLRVHYFPGVHAPPPPS